jgi:hypothetical protein
VTLREVEPRDTDDCARIVFEAFGEIHDHHNFPRDFPVPEAAQAMMHAWIPNPAVWGVVAEVDGRVVGCNFLDERDTIRGVGPITSRTPTTTGSRSKSPRGRQQPRPEASRALLRAGPGLGPLGHRQLLVGQHVRYAVPDPAAQLLATHGHRTRR